MDLSVNLPRRQEDWRKPIGRPRGDERNHSHIGKGVSIELERLGLSLRSKGSLHSLILIRTSLVSIPNEFRILQKDRKGP